MIAVAVLVRWSLKLGYLVPDQAEQDVLVLST
jgi:hypothetical protein